MQSYSYSHHAFLLGYSAAAYYIMQPDRMQVLLPLLPAGPGQVLASAVLQVQQAKACQQQGQEGQQRSSCGCSLTMHGTKLCHSHQW
jgi:uncharacterized protein (DUF3084 family)